MLNTISINDQAVVRDNALQVEQVTAESSVLSLDEFEQKLRDWENEVPLETNDRRALSEKFRLAYTETNRPEIYIGIPQRTLQISTLPKEVINHFQNLEKITLALPNLKEFPPLAQAMPNLKKLHLHNCSKLEQLPENFAQLFPNLGYLNCSRAGKLAVHVNQLAPLHHLTDLNIAGTATDFTQLFHDLPRLENLIQANGMPHASSVLEEFRAANLRRMESQRNSIVEILKQQDEAEIKGHLAQITASDIWPKADFDDYIKKVWSECVPGYFPKEDVFKVLDRAVNSTVLRDQLFSIALTSDLKMCVDNRIRAFNDMQIAVEVADTLADPQLKDLDKSAALLKILRAHYRNHLLSDFAEIKGKGSKEIVEIELFFRFRLKNELKLPCPVSNMKYETCAATMLTSPVRSEEIDQNKVKEILLEAKNFVFEKEKNKAPFVFWLLTDPNWQAWVNPKIADGLGELEAQFKLEMAELKENFAQLSEDEQDEQLIAHSEEKQSVESRYTQEKLELMSTQTRHILEDVETLPKPSWLGGLISSFELLPPFFGRF